MVKKSFPNAEQNANNLTNCGGRWGENPVDNIKIGGDAAQVMALEALSWILGRDDLLGNFLNNTGASPQDLAQLAKQPLFLGAVLDFLMEDDQRVIEFCADHSHPLTSVQAARASLPGAQYMHWT